MHASSAPQAVAGLPEATFQQLVSGGVAEAAITGADLHQPAADSTCATWELANRYVRPNLRRTRFVAAFAAACFQQLAASGHLAEPASICALASSREGKALLRRRGFQRVRPGEQIPDGLPLYLLELASAADWIELARSPLRRRQATSSD